jgi:hypothetical protein
VAELVDSAGLLFSWEAAIDISLSKRQRTSILLGGATPTPRRQQAAWCAIVNGKTM